MANSIKRKLLDAVVVTLRDAGIAGTSARTIAAAAGVNQSLVFYHFGTSVQASSASTNRQTSSYLG